MSDELRFFIFLIENYACEKNRLTGGCSEGVGFVLQTALHCDMIVTGGVSL